MNKPRPFITFVNHASVLISNGHKSVLSDPWYFGSAFHRGWQLIVETPIPDIFSILDETDYIWISHEHADHFSTDFFLHSDIRQKILDKKIGIIFQATRDRRITTFLARNGYNVTELEEEKKLGIDSDFDVYIQKCGFRDSTLIANVAGQVVYNLNDCSHFSTTALQRMRDKYGTCDLLLTQFSYAAWKGGPGNRAWRKHAAQEKLETMIKQANLLGAKKVLPFASFFYFANEMNSYLNDAINTPRAVRKALDDAGLECIFMTPMQAGHIDELKPDEKSFLWWENKISNVNKLPKLRYEESVDIDTLRKVFATHRKRILSKNSRTLIFILSKLPFLNAFRGVYIKLVDLDSLVVRYSLLDGLTEIDIHLREAPPLVTMHSSCLRLILEYDHGFSSLGVGGCFETDGKGFDALAKNLLLARLNDMGLTMSSAAFFKPDVILRFFRMLKKVRQKMSPK